MKTLIAVVIPVALLTALSAFAQNPSHDYSRTGNYYKEPVKYEVPAKRAERRKNAPNRSASQPDHFGASRDYSRIGNYYKEPVKYEVPAKRAERRKNASNRSASQTDHYGASRDYSRTGDYRKPKAMQPSGQRD